MPAGGTAGQVLTKLTDTDFEAEWQDSKGGAGLTPTIGDNGNWYLGDADTGKPSRGEQGPAGPKGDTGGTGPQGPRGEIGPQGPEGPQGEIGPKGDTGAQGPQGEMGPQGPRGEKGADGATGATGADGKSAFSYAQDGGYSGTEAEFAAKLAAESIDKALFVVNITTTDGVTYSADKTFEEITQAYNEGKYNIVAIMALRTGSHIMPLLAAQKTGAVFGMVLGQTRFSFVITSNNDVQGEAIQLATLQNKLHHPYPLTFTGAVSGSYDGSSAKTIEIPSGGTGGGGALAGLAIADNYDIELISHVIIDQNNIPTAGITVTQTDDGSPFASDGLLIWTDAKSARSYTKFNFNGYTNYPIEMTHGNKNLLSVYITDGTTMSIIIDRVRNIIKQSYADTGNIFYPDAIFQRVPEKFTSFKIGADGIASVKFYKAWGLTRK